jgi:hypothetical protein
MLAFRKDWGSAAARGMSFVRSTRVPGAPHKALSFLTFRLAFF